MFNLEELAPRISLEEGFKSRCYDDAQPNIKLKPGIIIKGTVTIGHGITWITEEESLVIVKNRILQLASDLATIFSWFDNLSNHRQEALIDMAYNLGEHSLETFGTFLGLMEQERYKEAADDLKITLWAKQVGQRAVHIEQLIREG